MKKLKNIEEFSPVDNNGIVNVSPTIYYNIINYLIAVICGLTIGVILTLFKYSIRSN